MSYNGRIEVPKPDLEEKENLKTNFIVDNKPKSRPGATESVLMQKVSRILQKRDLNKDNRTSSLYDGIDPTVSCKSLKHSKNDIISRINSKYGKYKQA